MAMGQRSGQGYGGYNRNRPPLRGQPSFGRSVVYEDFEPKSEWYDEDGAVVLRVHLLGFMRGQINYTKDERRGVVRVYGERAVLNKRLRFDRTFSVPQAHRCDFSALSVRFPRGVFTISFPIIVPPSPNLYYSEETQSSGDEETNGSLQHSEPGKRDEGGGREESVVRVPRAEEGKSEAVSQKGEEGNREADETTPEKRELMPEKTGEDREVSPEKTEEDREAAPAKIGEDKKAIGEKTVEDKEAIGEKTMEDTEAVPQKIGDDKEAIGEKTMEEREAVPAKIGNDKEAIGEKTGEKTEVIREETGKNRDQSVDVKKEAKRDEKPNEANGSSSLEKSQDLSSENVEVFPVVPSGEEEEKSNITERDTEKKEKKSLEKEAHDDKAAGKMETATGFNHEKPMKDDDWKLMVNIGVAVLVIMGLGSFIFNKIV